MIHDFRGTEVSMGIFSTRESNITLQVEITEKLFAIGIVLVSISLNQMKNVKMTVKNHIGCEEHD